MISFHVAFAHRNDKTEDGFTLIEVLIALLIGAIVMGMSIAILGATNSASLRVMSKSTAQENTRDSISKILSSLADAESPELCRVGKDAAIQASLSTAAGNPNYSSGISPDDCKETVSTGIVIAWAQPNELCYFKTQHHDPTGPIPTVAPYLECIARGGAGHNSSYFGTPPTAHAIANSTTITTAAGVDIGSCVNANVGTDPNLIYEYSCLGTGPGNSLDWPKIYGTSVKSNVIADLGVQVSATPQENLFDYRTVNPSPPILNGEATPTTDLTTIVAVDVKMNTQFDTHSTKKIDQYIFHQTIVLRGSKLAQEENYNG